MGKLDNDAIYKFLLKIEELKTLFKDFDFKNIADKDTFLGLYERLVTGGILKPYLHDIEPLTTDGDGKVYYKNHLVKEYMHGFENTECAKRQVLELKNRCEYLEKIGHEFLSGNGSWNWGNYFNSYGEFNLNRLRAILPENKTLPFSNIEICEWQKSGFHFLAAGHMSLYDILDQPIVTDVISIYNIKKCDVMIEHYSYGSGELMSSEDLIINRPKVESLLDACFNYMQINKLIHYCKNEHHITDFSDGYESVKELENLLDRGNKSFVYSTISIHQKHREKMNFFACGDVSAYDVMNRDDVKRYFNYNGYDNNSVYTHSYVFGNNIMNPLSEHDLKNPDAVIKQLEKCHDYMNENQIVKEKDSNYFELKPSDKQNNNFEMTM